MIPASLPDRSPSYWIAIAVAITAIVHSPSALADTQANLLSDVTQMLVGLAAVLAVIFALLHILKRFGVHPAGAGPKVIGSTAVGPREKVVLVEIGSNVLVLGVAPGHVTHLHTVSSAELASSAPPPVKDTPFKDRLQQLMERKA